MICSRGDLDQIIRLSVIDRGLNFVEATTGPGGVDAKCRGSRGRDIPVTRTAPAAKQAKRSLLMRVVIVLDNYVRSTCEVKQEDKGLSGPNEEDAGLRILGAC